MSASAVRAALSVERAYLVRFARRRLRDASLVEDVVQETLLAALRDANGYAQRASLRTWLTGILLYKIADGVRSQSRLSAGDARGGDGFEERGAAEPIDWHDPERLLADRQAVQAVQRSLGAMPRQVRRAFALREIDGLSSHAAAEALGVTSAQCAVLLYRARARLRRDLQQHGARPDSPARVVERRSVAPDIVTRSDEIAPTQAAGKVPR